MAGDVLDITVSLSRTVGGPLVVDEAHGYTWTTFGVLPRRWRRRFVQGRWQNGRRLVSAVLDQSQISGRVKVSGATWVAANGAVNTLVAALSQRSYLATVVLEGVTYEFDCEPADWALAGGEAWDPVQLMDSEQEYAVTIPVMPS